MVNLPSGTVTFVFSDIESSTTLLKRLGDTDYGTLLSAHKRCFGLITRPRERGRSSADGDQRPWHRLRRL